MLVVVFATLVLTLALLGSTTDKILTEAVKNDQINAVNQGKLKFQSLDERQHYIDTQIELNIKALGLNEPWYSPTRFGNTILKLAVLDLGQSHFFTSDSGSSNVRDIILEKLPRTILLFTSSTVIITVIGLFIGGRLADKPGSAWDKMNTFLAVSSSSFPSWWVGMLMIFAFAFVYPIFPARSTPLLPPSDPYYIFDLLYCMILPLITVVIVGFSSWAYIVRYFLAGILREDFILAKSAMGIPKKKVVYSHGLKNAAPPIITSIALALASSFAGSIIIEAVFDWPGMGKLYYDAIGVMDIPVIIGITYVSTLIFVVTIFVVDLVYAYLDPRVKVG